MTLNKNRQELLVMLGASMITAIAYYLFSAPKDSLRAETSFSSLDEVLLYVPTMVIFIFPTAFLFIYQIYKKEVVKDGN